MEIEVKKSEDVYFGAIQNGKVYSHWKYPMIMSRDGKTTIFNQVRGILEDFGEDEDAAMLRFAELKELVPDRPFDITKELTPEESVIEMEKMLDITNRFFS